MKTPTQQVTDRVVAAYLSNVEMKSPGLRRLLDFIRENRPHFAEGVKGRVFWGVVERDAFGTISANLRVRPQLASNLREIRLSQSGSISEVMTSNP